MKPDAQLFFPHPAQPFAPKSIFKLFSLVCTVYWLERHVALSLWVALPFIWLYLFPLRDLKASDRSLASLQLQSMQRRSCDFWLNKFRAVKWFFYFILFIFPLLFCGESSLKSGLGFNRKPGLQLVDIDNCCHLAGCCCLEWSKFGGLNLVITKAGVSELVPPYVVLIES